MVLYLLLIILQKKMLLKRLDASKVWQEDDIPTKIIKENSDIFSNFIHRSFNNLIDVCIFPKSLELANITSVYKTRLKEFNGKLQAGKYLAKYLKNLRKMPF